MDSVRIDISKIESENYESFSKTATLESLILGLQEIAKVAKKDTRILTEGCDCWGNAAQLDYDPTDNTILITRR